MPRFSIVSALLFVAGAAFAQTPIRSATSSGVIWEPPALHFLGDVLPKATVPKEMLATLLLSHVPVSLEKTELVDIKNAFGGTIGSKGDAGEFVEWLCFHGADSGGRWALWLESSEINGGTVGGFRWQRLPGNAVLDNRCRMLADTKVVLPIALRLDIGKTEVQKSLGRPSLSEADRLIYVHEQEGSIRGEPYTSINVVAILLRAGQVWAIAVTKTTSS